MQYGPQALSESLSMWVPSLAFQSPRTRLSDILGSRDLIDELRKLLNTYTSISVSVVFRVYTSIKNGHSKKDFKTEKQGQRTTVQTMQECVLLRKRKQIDRLLLKQICTTVR